MRRTEGMRFMDNLECSGVRAHPAVKTRKWDVGSVEDELGERTIYRETESSDSSGRVAPRVAGDSNADRSHARVPCSCVCSWQLSHVTRAEDARPVTERGAHAGACAMRCVGHHIAHTTRLSVSALSHR